MLSIAVYAWIIPLFPLLAFVLITTVGRQNRKFSHTVAIYSVWLSLVASQVIFWTSVITGTPSGPGSHTIPWLNLGTGELGIGTYIDPVAALMMLVVPFVCLIIFIYSIGYLNHDPQYSRFFAYVSLFAFAMLGLVICDNLLALFVFWEIMGTCSYLLIGFWFQKPKASAAALKAFLVTKVGDIFLLIGLLILYSETGTLAYRNLFQPDVLEALSTTVYFQGISAATVISLLIFAGTVGKSAQFPLHVWLPDAMEGPTPASALIHAATMVSAGIYLIIRMFPLLQVSQVLPVIAFIGTFTALFASVIAITQDDIKRVLAYSTISQLGYMVAAVGIGAYKASLFHLVTHTFFKALLFLGAGSVIHSVEHGHQIARGHAQRTEHTSQAFSPNNMMFMGGLLKRMPVTGVAYIVGALTLAGFPLITSGFWSKDGILTEAWMLNRDVFWGLAIAAGLTAFYIMRQISLVFLGNPRTQASSNADENGNTIIIPLLILALFSIVVGWVGIPDGFPILSRIVPDLLEGLYKSETFSVTIAQTALSTNTVHTSQHFAWSPMLMGILFPALGLFTGWILYGRVPLESGDEDPIVTVMQFIRLRWLYNLVKNRFYFDEIYSFVFVRSLTSLADLTARIDSEIIDKIVLSLGNAAVFITNTVHNVDDAIFYTDLSGVKKINFTGLINWIDAYIFDEIANLIAFTSNFLAGVLRQIDERLVDGFVKRISSITYSLGSYVRRLQNGLISDYLWNAFLMVLLIIATITFLQ